MFTQSNEWIKTRKGCIYKGASIKDVRNWKVGPLSRKGTFADAINALELVLESTETEAAV